MTSRILFLLLAFVALASTLIAQQPAQPHHEYPGILQYYGSLFAGPSASLAGTQQAGAIVGASLGGVVAFGSMRAFTFPGFDMELAAIHPVQPNLKLDGIFSFNLQPAFLLKSSRAAPYVTAGYSRVFVSGNAINFGAGINLFPKNAAETMNFLRIELRDYFTFASERQHEVTLRVAFCFGIPDV